MQAQRISRTRRREDVLYVVNDERSASTSNVADALNYALSTVRRDLEWLEEHGFVEGFKHDERNLGPEGRIRIYWSATEKGKAYLAEREITAYGGGADA